MSRLIRHYKKGRSCLVKEIESNNSGWENIEGTTARSLALHSESRVLLRYCLIYFLRLFSQPSTEKESSLFIHSMEILLIIIRLDLVTFLTY